jgi:hypothetical protein
MQCFCKDCKGRSVCKEAVSSTAHVRNILPANFEPNIVDLHVDSSCLYVGL